MRIENMFAYNILSSHRRPSPAQQRARHFAFTERRCLDWNRHSTLVLIAALALGGCAKVFALPMAAIALTLAVIVNFIEERPALDTPLWMGRLALACTGMFYAGLGYSLGAIALVAVPALLSVHRLIFR